MKRRDPLPIGALIARAIEASGSTDTYRRQQACYLWSEDVGPTINRATVRRWIVRDELHVVISSGPVKNELSFMASGIVDAINQALGTSLISRLVIH